MGVNAHAIKTGSAGRRLAAIGTLLFLTATAAWAQTLPAAGDQGNLWIAQSQTDGQQFTLFHRREADPQQQLRAVTRIRGRLMGHGLAAGHGQLWLVYSDWGVQSLRLTTGLRPGEIAYDLRVERSLPKGMVRSLAVTRDGLWALMRIEDAATLAQIDHPPTTQGSTPTAPSTTPATAEAPATRSTPAIRTDRLIYQDRQRWVRHPLPEDWPAPSEPDLRRWVVTADQNGDRPLLIVEAPGPRPAQALWVYEWTGSTEGGQWQRRQVQMPIGADFVPLVVSGQLVAGQRQSGQGPLTIELSVLRSEGTHSLGQIAMPDTVQEPIRWNLAAVGQTVALVAQDKNAKLWWASMDLMGQTTLPPTPLKEDVGQSLLYGADYIIMVAALVLAVVVLFTFWRREAAENKLELPKDIILADLGRRLAAGVVDLAPCVLLVALFLPDGLTEMPYSWPGRAGSWTAMWPGAAAIGLYVLHTLVAELIWGRSLGKAMFGMRVANMKGQKPAFGQILVRNLLKVMDLVAWPLLVLPMIGPFRQRLGDLVGRTVVVMPQPPVEEEE